MISTLVENGLDLKTLSCSPHKNLEISSSLIFSDPGVALNSTDAIFGYVGI
jgi:hypothetical protein